MENSDATSEIGSRLKAERERLKLTQVELAALGGVTNVTQSRYESGLSSPNAAYLGAFSRAGGDVLFVVAGARGAGGATGKPGLSAAEEALLANFGAADEQGKAVIEGAARLAVGKKARQRKSAR